MVVTTADLYAPDFATLPFTYFLTLHRIAGMEPTPFSPSPLTPSLYRRNNIQHNVPSDAKMFSTSPSSCFMLPASLKTKLAFSTSMARGGMLKVVTPGGERAWFDVVLLNAYKECSALVQEDRDDTFCVSSASRLSTRPPNAYSAELVQFL